MSFADDLFEMAAAAQRASIVEPGRQTRANMAAAEKLKKLVAELLTYANALRVRDNMIASAHVGAALADMVARIEE